MDLFSESLCQVLPALCIHQGPLFPKAQVCAGGRLGSLVRLGAGVNRDAGPKRDVGQDQAPALFVRLDLAVWIARVVLCYGGGMCSAHMYMMFYFGGVVVCSSWVCDSSAVSRVSVHGFHDRRAVFLLGFSLGVGLPDLLWFLHPEPPGVFQD